jgi:DegV family protein with EDD domain
VELTAENTAIVVDSTADFPEGPQRFPNWRMVPLYVRFGEQSYRDYVELGPAEFYARLRQAPELPTTSQPTPGDFLAAYEDLAGYERILSLHIAREFSGTVEAARRAAEEVGGDRVRVVDSRTASAAVALLALAIQQQLERGTSDEEIDRIADRHRREAGLLFTVDTLEYLARGGRIGRAQAMAGQVLSVKPVLTIREGEVVPVKRVRGSQRALEELVAGLVAGSAGAQRLHVSIAHADAPERLARLHELVLAQCPDARIELETELGAVIGTHAGPGAIGLFWIEGDAEE